MKIVFATGNKGKLREAAEILGSGFELLSSADVGITEDVEETGETLEENSIIKAEYIHSRLGGRLSGEMVAGEAGAGHGSAGEIMSGLDCFADDTGLEVDALGGAPGVHSARYATAGHDFDANIDKLLAELEKHPGEPRTARFRSVITLIYKGERHFFEGTLEGVIAPDRRGANGFGYDPVFIPDGYPDNTVAELDDATKNAISHRGKALRAMADWLRGKEMPGCAVCDGKAGQAVEKADRWMRS